MPDIDEIRDLKNEFQHPGHRGTATTSDEFTRSSDDDKTLPHFLASLKEFSEDDIEEKAARATLILESDAETLLRRLEKSEKQRDLSQLNLEREHTYTINFFQSVKHTCPDCQTQELVGELQSQLDAILSSATAAAMAAQAFGYVRCEVEMSKIVAPLLRFIVNASQPRPLPTTRLEFIGLDRDDERVLRRRSVAAVPISKESRRRASIPFLPNSVITSTSRNGSAATVPPHTHTHSPVTEVIRRESVVTRPRREPRLQEPTMEEIEECPTEIIEAVSKKKSKACCIHGPRFSSGSSHPFTDALRYLLQCHLDFVHAARFRWPSSPTEFRSFVLTWYLVICFFVFIVAGVFIGRLKCKVSLS